MNAVFRNVMPSRVAEFTNVLEEPAASIFSVSRVSHYRKQGGKDMVLQVNLWEMLEPRGGRNNACDWPFLS